MDTDISKLFDKVSRKCGWLDMDETEAKLINAIGKSRRPGTSDAECDSPDTDAEHLDKENLQFGNRGYRSNVTNVSSDDDFEQFLKAQATPKTHTHSRNIVTSARKQSIVVLSSDSDGTFETFLEKVKTPIVKPRTILKNRSQDSLQNFIVNDSSSDDDDFIVTKPSRVRKNTQTPSQPLMRKPLSQFDSPVFVSESDDEEDNIVIKSTWKSRRAQPQPSSNKKKSSPLVAAEPSPLIFSSKTVNSLDSDLSDAPKRTFSAPSRLDETASSEEEFASLLDRLKKKNILQVGSPSPAPRKEITKSVATPNPANSKKSSETKPISENLHKFVTPTKNPILKPALSQSVPPPVSSSKVLFCKTPGCFLETLSNPGSKYCRNFRQTKDELTNKLFRLYNASVFDGKLPASMSVTWNKKMRKTAGYCITGQEKGKGNRYARIELSEKVCDSADRLRDTLIHEMCHAATWLINGVRDGHGNFWKLYARKSTVVHPELPMVTRCHSYDIKYKFQYQCTRCKNTIGRHSKSLDTEKFVCALCTGKLVLLNPSKPRTPTPFASFVKENYGAVRQELAGQSHAEVMRKLSADFSLKTKLSQS